MRYQSNETLIMINVYNVGMNDSTMSKDSSSKESSIDGILEKQFQNVLNKQLNEIARIKW